MLEFLPSVVKEAIERVNQTNIYEIRLRAGKPVTVNFAGEYRYLGAYGLTDKVNNALIVGLKEIEDCVYRAGKCSVYSVEEQIRQGFITADGGERLGLAGEFVVENGKTLTIRNFSSLCIRVPHEIIGCSNEIYRLCCLEGIENLLIASPPGLGKTTILRDLTRNIAKKTAKNILVCDERGEISCKNTGESVDIFRYADKKTAFEAGIRAMRPDIIVTDELSGDDLFAIKRAVQAGVKVIASAHFSKEDIPPSFFGVFERYVFLKVGALGQIGIMYDRDIKEICMT